MTCVVELATSEENWRARLGGGEVSPRRARLIAYLRECVRWADATERMRKGICNGEMFRWQQSREEPGRVYCTECGRTSRVREAKCYPLVIDAPHRGRV